MESIEWMQLLTGTAMGLALAATCGLRAFLPLFAVGCLGATGQIELAESFQWLQRPIALFGLGVAVLLEVAGDKFPVVDHVLDSAAVFVKPVAAAVAAASVMTETDPVLTAVLGLLVGGTMAEGVHLVKAKARLLSSAMTATIANPLISLMEDVLAIVSTVLAIVLPFVVVAIALIAPTWGFGGGLGAENSRHKSQALWYAHDSNQRVLKG